MNDPSVAVSPEDTAQTSGDRGRAGDLVQETIMRFGIWTARWQLAGPRRALLLFTGFAWLIIAVIVLRFTLASVTTDVLACLVAVVVGFLAHDVAGRTEQGARAAAAAGAAGGRVSRCGHRRLPGNGEPEGDGRGMSNPLEAVIEAHALERWSQLDAVSARLVQGGARPPGSDTNRLPAVPSGAADAAP